WNFGVEGDRLHTLPLKRPELSTDIYGEVLSGALRTEAALELREQLVDVLVQCDECFPVHGPLTRDPKGRRARTENIQDAELTASLAGSASLIALITSERAPRSPIRAGCHHGSPTRPSDAAMAVRFRRCRTS